VGASVAADQAKGGAENARFREKLNKVYDSLSAFRARLGTLQATGK
jgi:hypothetical protein